VAMDDLQEADVARTFLHCSLLSCYPTRRLWCFQFTDTGAYTEGEANKKGLRVMMGDVLSYKFEPSSFDRVVSIKLFEHMKNYQLLLAKATLALGLQGKLFVHIIPHKESAYDFEDGWMSTHSFTGGTILLVVLFHVFQDGLRLQRQW
jgi:cyclopropane fatty-acyl-phospholipid synthase-like methyltransferase